MRKILGTSEYRFAILAFVWGVLFSFLIIPWQTPDEYAHLSMIVEGVGNIEVDDVFYQNMELESGRIRFYPEEGINHDQWKAALTQKQSYKELDCVPRRLSLDTLRHFPAFLGIYLGILLHLPIYWVMQLGEIFSLLFYIVTCFWALKVTPVKKQVFEVVMMIPMCIQQASSISYDSVLLPLCFLFFAYFLYVYFDKEIIGLKDLGILMSLIVIIAICKLPYIAIGGVMVALPFEKVSVRVGKYVFDGKSFFKKKQYIIILILGIIILGCGALWILRDNSEIQILKYSILQWGRTTYLFSRTIYNFGNDLVTGFIGCFGYLDTPMPAWFIYGFLNLIILLSFTNVRSTDEKEKALRIKDKIIFLVVALFLTYAITLSMVGHTAKVTMYGDAAVDVALDYSSVLYQIPYIGGLQGRYYLPFLLMFLVTFPERLKMEKKTYDKGFVAWIVFCLVFTSIVVYARFW